MITVSALSKSFGRLQVLDGLDLSLSGGNVTAVVGPNGSGKTTLIKCMLGLCRPDGGEIEIDGVSVGHDAAYRSRIGYMPQIPPFPENLTPREILALLRDLRGADAAVDLSLIEEFDLDSELDKPVRTLSGGTRQKVSAVVAFLFDPAVLILDEPTAGLDPVASSTLKDRIRLARDAGRTILLTSHIMSEIEELADEAVFLLEGKVRFSGSVADLKRRTGQTRLERAVADLMRSSFTLFQVAA